MQYAIEAFTTGAQDLSDVPAHAIPSKPQQVPTLIKSLGGVLIVDELLKHKERFRAALLKPMDSYAFQCIAAANPCPCGHFNSPVPCKCTPIALENHRQRFQAALRDRFDICLPITAPRQEFEAAETSTQIQRRVHQAWSIQMSRQGKQNAQLSEEEILFLGLVPQNIYQWLVEHCVEWRISIRGRRQVLGVALTIMDLAEQPRMDLAHLQEALLMRD
jgi:magnesium chelatase family protein